jgi:Na+/alanine symporter
VAVALLFGYAWSWVMAALGLVVRTPEAVQAAAYRSEHMGECWGVGSGHLLAEPSRAQGIRVAASSCAVASLRDHV